MTWLVPILQKPSQRIAVSWQKWCERFLIVLIIAAVLSCSCLLAITPPSASIACLLQTGWNVQQGREVYASSVHGFHHAPLVAILVAPFGSPQQGDSHAVPVVLTRMLWFLLNAGALSLAIHWIVKLLEQRSTSNSSSITALRWWLHRLVPLGLLLNPITTSFQAGNANGLLLLLMASLLKNLVHQRSLAAGMTIAGAIFLNLWAVVLLFVPIWRRDRAMTMGILLGLFLVYLLLPSLVFGLQRTSRLNEQCVEVVKQELIHNLSAGQDHPLLAGLRSYLPALLINHPLWMLMLLAGVLSGLALITCWSMSLQEEVEAPRMVFMVSSLLAILVLLNAIGLEVSSMLLLPAVISLLVQGVLNKTASGMPKYVAPLVLIIATALTWPGYQVELTCIAAGLCWLLTTRQLYLTSAFRQQPVDALPASTPALAKAA